MPAARLQKPGFWLMATFFQQSQEMFILIFVLYLNWLIFGDEKRVK
jgi:hypothetical protein